MASEQLTLREVCLAEQYEDAIAGKNKRIADLEAAIQKAITHADGNGMRDWPVFKKLRSVLQNEKIKGRAVKGSG